MYLGLTNAQIYLFTPYAYIKNAKIWRQKIVCEMRREKGTCAVLTPLSDFTDFRFTDSGFRYSGVFGHADSEYDIHFVI